MGLKPIAIEITLTGLRVSEAALKSFMKNKDSVRVHEPQKHSATLVYLRALRQLLNQVRLNIEH